MQELCNRTGRNPNFQYIQIGCSNHAEQQILKFARSAVKKPFSIGAMIRSVVWPRRTSHKNYFCAELIVSALQAGGLMDRASNPGSASPESIYRAFANCGTTTGNPFTLRNIRRDQPYIGTKHVQAAQAKPTEMPWKEPTPATMSNLRESTDGLVSNPPNQPSHSGHSGHSDHSDHSNRPSRSSRLDLSNQPSHYVVHPYHPQEAYLAPHPSHQTNQRKRQTNKQHGETLLDTTLRRAIENACRECDHRHGSRIVSVYSPV